MQSQNEMFQNVFNQPKPKTTNKRAFSALISILKSISLFLLLLLYIFYMQNRHSLERKSRLWTLKTSPALNVRRLFDLNEAAENSCKRGSEELQNYYTGNGTLDLSEINLEDSSEGSLSEPVSVVLELIENPSSIDMNKAITYGKHVIISLVSLVLGILMLLLLVILILCNCCDCCCCCCCKKKVCKCPCFLISLVMNAAIAACCIYGFSQSNKLFEGLGSMTCSMLQFSKEFLIFSIKLLPFLLQEQK